MTTGPPATLATRVCSEAAEPLVVAPPPSLVRAFVSRLAATTEESAESPAHVRLLCTEATIESTMTDFLTASAAADAVAEGRLTIRTAESLESSVTLADDTVYAHVSVSDPQSGDLDTSTVFGDVAGDDDSLAAALSEPYDRVWADAEPYELDVPRRSVVVDSFRERWPEAGETLAATFAAAETLPTDGVVDPTLVCTLVAARHRLLTMHLGEWAEAIDFSSRTEVSRAKSRLVDADLVDTEPEAEGVGRPRHRLVPTAAVASASGAELLAVARSTLTE